MTGCLSIALRLFLDSRNFLSLSLRSFETSSRLEKRKRRGGYEKEGLINI